MILIKSALRKRCTPAPRQQSSNYSTYIPSVHRVLYVTIVVRTPLHTVDYTEATQADPALETWAGNA